jgi:hypothetical protein
MGRWPDPSQRPWRNPRGCRWNCPPWHPLHCLRSHQVQGWHWLPPAHQKRQGSWRHSAQPLDWPLRALGWEQSARAQLSLQSQDVSQEEQQGREAQVAVARVLAALGLAQAVGARALAVLELAQAVGARAQAVLELAQAVGARALAVLELAQAVGARALAALGLARVAVPESG